MKKPLIILSALLSLVALGILTSKAILPKQDNLRQYVQNEVPEINHYFNELNQAARIIAGINAPADTIFPHVCQSEAWKAYAEESNSMWNNYFSKNSALINWANNEVYPHSKGIKTLFYPFSGPDFLYANLFFPDAEMIYLLGLEKLGSVPQFKQEQSIESYINAYKTSINEVLADSYYRTKEMMLYLNNQNVDGVIPVIMLFMARSGKQICDINYVTINPNGVIIPSSQVKINTEQNKGVEFKYYSAGNETQERRLVFFSGDVQERALVKNPAMKKYLDNIKTQAAFFKSASYLMHDSSFITIRNTILKGSDIVVSDDSGIPFHFYDPKIWDVQLYGSYKGCINDFKHIYENELKSAYDDSLRMIKPLSFRIGYSYPSNMRIVVRK